VKNRRTSTPTGQRKRQKAIRYIEDDEKGGGELKQLIKIGTYGIRAIERGRRLGDG